MSEVRGRSREDPMTEGRRPRGATARRRSGAAAERSYWLPRSGAAAGRSYPPPKDRVVAERSQPTSKEQWLHKQWRA